MEYNLYTGKVAGAGGGKAGGGGGVDAADTLFSHQYARVMDAVCEGPIVGLATGDGRSVYLDGIPLLNNNPAGLLTTNFKNVVFSFRDGSPNQAVIPGFNYTENTISSPGEVKYGIPRYVTINSPTVDSVRLTVGVPALVSADTSGNTSGTSVSYSVDIQPFGGTFAPANIGVTKTTILSGATNIVTTVATATVVDIAATIGTIASGGTPLAQLNNANLAAQIQAATLVLEVSQAGGAWSTLSALPAPTQTPRKVLVNGITKIMLDYTSGVLGVTLPTAGAYSLRVRDTITGTTYPFSAGVYSSYNIYTITGKCTNEYQVDHILPLSQYANSDFPLQIRLTRNTVDSTNIKLQNRTIWKNTTEITNSSLNYPNTAIAALQIDARHFSSVPARAYDLKLLKVQVPSNYFPEKLINYTLPQAGWVQQKYTRDPITGLDTGTYQIWDGTFYVAWTDNPAWCFYDLLTNTRYGLGNNITNQAIDVASLYTIAQYCDEPVPTGYGVTGPNGQAGAWEPRFTCNTYIQSRADAYQLINTMASIFRAMVYWDSVRGMTAVQDAPGVPVAMFTNANIINGEFNYSGSASQARHTIAMVSFNDPAESYKSKVEYVENTAELARYGANQIDVTAFGCTSRGQAHRLGKWILYSEAYETETVSFKTGLEGIAIKPGDIIKTADRYRSGVRWGGRIVKAYPVVSTISFAPGGSISNTSPIVGYPYQQITAYAEVLSSVATTIDLAIDRVGTVQNNLVSFSIPANTWTRITLPVTLDSGIGAPVFKMSSVLGQVLQVGKCQLNDSLISLPYELTTTTANSRGNLLTYSNTLVNPIWVATIGTVATDGTNGLIFLDSSITLDFGSIYTISSQMPDGSILDAVVNNPTTALLPSTTNDILSVPALAVMPQETAIWTVSSSVLTPEIWRILSIIEDSKGIYSVSALEHNASKFSAIENNTILTTPTVSLIQLIPDAVTNLAVVGARYVISPGIQGTKMTLSWDASPTATKYIVSYTENQGNPIEVTTTSTTVDILNAVAGATYSVTVTAYNSLGVASV